MSVVIRLPVLGQSQTVVKPKPIPKYLPDYFQHSIDINSKESNDEEINLILATGSTRGNSDP